MVEPLSRSVRSKYAEQMALEIEGVALSLFEGRGFAEVTVEEIAAAAGISARTFYRHFPTKEEIFQVRLDQRAKALRKVLVRRPVDESPLHSLREALFEVVAAEDANLRRRWMVLIESSPTLVRAALGGMQLREVALISEFFSQRLRLPPDDLTPTILAAATGGVLLNADARWLLEGGSLEQRIAEALDALDRVVDVGALARSGEPTTDS